MLIAFYAPLKSPVHNVPSGDRKIARLLIHALQLAGHRLEIISHLRSFEGAGDKIIQEQIKCQAQVEVTRLIDYYQNAPKPDLIFIYHAYHKAPDWIGYALAKTFKVPYFIAEASFAPKQKNGLWRTGHIQTQACISLAQGIIALNPIDLPCIYPLLNPTASTLTLAPFLIDPNPDKINETNLRSKMTKTYNLNPDIPWLVTVAMMRYGDKAASYQQLVQSYAAIQDQTFSAIIIGNGDTSTQIQTCFSSLSVPCIFTGQLSGEQINQLLVASDMFVWPAINEAFGLAILEAQSLGLACVVQNYGGVSSIVEDKITGFVTDKNQPSQFIQAISALLDEPIKRKAMGLAARDKFLTHHTLESASKHLDSFINKHNIESE